MNKSNRRVLESRIVVRIAVKNHRPQSVAFIRFLLILIYEFINSIKTADRS